MKFTIEVDDKIGQEIINLALRNERSAAGQFRWLLNVALESIRKEVETDKTPADG